MKLIKELLIFFAMAMTNNANAALLCEIDLTTSPITCDNFLGSSHSDSDRVYNCSGGSSVTEFEVWGGCGPNYGSGHWDNPVVQTPSGVKYALNAAGRHSYCQIKSINGINLAPYNRWVYSASAATPDNCASVATRGCSRYAKEYPDFRSVLFQTLQ